MTDLNLAYGYLDDTVINTNNEYMNDLQTSQMNNTDNLEVEKNNNNIIVEKKQKKHKMNTTDYDERPIIQRQNDNLNLPTTLISNDSVPDYPVAKKYNNNQQQQQQQVENTFWNRLSYKRNEVFKLVMFSLVILLAISLDRMASYYLSKYVNENVLTDNQEMIIRFAYPVIIVLILWFLKAL
tara:strand:- start:5348 stop:5893 length:546 start_codon:yes stop_codon:yes gene_type:complete